jgi:hypothetical protein
VKVQFHKFTRHELTVEQRIFLQSVLSQCVNASNWIALKAGSRGVLAAVGIRPSVLCADIILRSNWGTHPVSKLKCNRHSANNLSLVEATGRWLEGKKCLVFEDKPYRSYSSWEAYFDDISDLYGMSGMLDTVLNYYDTRRQIYSFSQIMREEGYGDQMIKLVIKYGLDEFDLV